MNSFEARGGLIRPCYLLWLGQGGFDLPVSRWSKQNLQIVSFSLSSLSKGTQIIVVLDC